MLVTVKDAKSKICPMGMVDGEGESTCYGPECMAWRWFDKPQLRSVDCTGKYLFTQQEPERPEGMDKGWYFVPGDREEGWPSGWREPEEEVMARRLGYCGVGGMPEVR